MAGSSSQCGSTRHRRLSTYRKNRDDRSNVASEVEYVRCQTSSESATTIKQSAELSGDPMGEPRICSKTLLPMENWVICSEERMISSMSRMWIFRVTFNCRQVRPFTTSPAELPFLGLIERIASGCVSMMCDKNLRRRYQLSINRGMSMLVKKPARSWLKMRGRGPVSKFVVCRRRMRSNTSPLAKL